MDVVIIYGTFIFSESMIRDILDYRIFLDTDEDIRLSRRVYRDVCLAKKPLE